MVKNEVCKAVRHLLRPIVLVLLRNGVTWSEFADIGKEVFVDVARDEFGIQGRPTNTARVSLITGLSRREVSRVKTILVGERKRAQPPPNRISQILTAWHRDPAFLAADGTPAVLAATGDGPSIETLLKHYAGDAPHGAVLKELLQLGLVESTAGGFRVRSREYIRSAADPDLIRQAGVALHDHAATIAHNVDTTRTESPRLERMATNAALPRRHVRAFQQFLAAESRTFLEKVDTWLAARAARPAPGRKSAAGRTLRTGVGIFLIHDETRGELR